MRKIGIILGLFVLVASCSSDAPVEESASNNVETSEAIVTPNQLLTMEIDGMVCQMGCGGSIRKELNATGGVSGVEFDFEDERKTNVAKISFDNTQISVDEMVKLISTMNDGQFTIGSTSVEDIHEISTSNKSSAEHHEEVHVEASSSNVEIPNLLDLLSSFLVG